MIYQYGLIYYEMIKIFKRNMIVKDDKQKEL
jgi:hypothetical protein